MKILNAKIAQIQEFFERQINTITFHSETLMQKVALLEQANKGGVKFSDLDTERLIQLVGQVEGFVRDKYSKLCKIDPTFKSRPETNRPRVIWDLLSSHFGNEFFLEVIESDLGLTPGHNATFETQIIKHFEQDIEQLKNEHITVE